MQPLRETHGCGVPAFSEADERWLHLTLQPASRPRFASALPVCAPHVAPLDPEITPRTTGTDETWRIFSTLETVEPS